MEIVDNADTRREYDNVRDNIKPVILNDLIREDEERMQAKDILVDDTLYNKSFSLNATLKHDQSPDISYHSILLRPKHPQIFLIKMN